MAAEPTVTDPAEVRSDPWRGLYRMGAWACVVALALIAAAVAAFFVWPLGYHDSAEVVLTRLHERPLDGFMRLDPAVLVGWLAMLPIGVTVAVALRDEAPAMALGGGVLAAVATAVIVPARPLLELVELADLHAAATTEAARAGYEAAAAPLLAVFEGTAWLVGSIFINIAFLTLSAGMLSSQRFARSTALLGVWTAVLGMGFLIPVVGPMASLAATILGLLWLALLGRDLWRLATPAAVRPVGIDVNRARSEGPSQR